MSKKTLASSLAVLVLVSLVVPATFFIAPRRASAQAFTGCLGGLIGGVIGGVANGASSVPVNDKPTESSSASAAGSTWASCINAFIIEPLIRAAIHALIQKLTASVITWINGGNGTGQPSYVQNLPGHLRTVSDTQALAFFAQVGANSNSPFAAAITSSLATNYLQNTSSAGFFGANKDTLVAVAGSAANEQAFLNGNWSQGGGTAAWFALTTQPQNNPYMLYQASQSQLGSLVTGAQSARLNELSWGNGFLSWCGPTGVGTAPGNTCTNKDGSPGMTQTPGTIIAGYANQAVVNTGFQELVSAQDIDSALSAVISALLNKVLSAGGAAGGGLFSNSQTGSTGASALTAQLQTYATAGGAAGGAAASAALQTELTQTTNYTNAWQTISTAANTASAAVGTLVSACTAASATAEATAAQNAITTEIAPILAQANAAATTAAIAQNMIQKIQSEISSGIDATTDLATLQAIPPSATDASTAVQNATVTNAATATPVGSLTVTGGTIMDQMNLIAANAATLQTTVCP